MQLWRCYLLSIEEAQKGLSEGGIPIGSVLVKDGKEVTQIKGKLNSDQLRTLADS
jgi:tRNA(Arg) A34 adenosine deaminase TadA